MQVNKKIVEQSIVRKGIDTKALEQAMVELLTNMSPDQVKIPVKYRDQVLIVKQMMRSDTSGLIGSLIDFAITCFEDGTEVFTDTGWKDFKDLKLTDLVYSMDPINDNKVILSPIKNIIAKQYSGELVCFENKSLSFSVTPDHKMLVNRKTTDRTKPKNLQNVYKPYYEFVNAENLSEAMYLKRTLGEWEGTTCDKFDIGSHTFSASHFMTFLGWYLSEGSIYEPANRIIISQVKESNRKLIISLLENMGFTPRAESCNIIIHSKELCQWLKKNCYDQSSTLVKIKTIYNCYNKRVPVCVKNLNRFLLSQLLDSIVLGDGHNRDNRITYYTTSRGLADDVQELFLKIGRFASMSEQAGRTVTFKNRSKQYIGKTQYIVYVRKHEETSYIRKENLYKKQYDGIVRCVEVEPYHTIFVRYKGEAFWSGNCSLVDYTVETDNDNLTKIFQAWMTNINQELRGQIPTGMKALAKQYFTERWKGSSFILMRSIWEDVDGFILPTKLWFVNGEDIVINDGNADSFEIGKETYSLKLGRRVVKNLPASKDEKIFVQKPFETWGTEYPIPYIIRRGLYKNGRLFDILATKGEYVVGKALEYLLLIKKGSEQLALSNQPEYTYSDADLRNIKVQMEDLLSNRRLTPGVPTHATNFDTDISHLIPDYKQVLAQELFEPIERRIMAGLGLIDVLQGVASTRKETQMNPRPFIAEVENGISDFKMLLNDILQTIIEVNQKGHPKHMGTISKIHSTPIQDFITEQIRGALKDMYDRGVLSKRTYGEVVGNVDFDIELSRRKVENEAKLEEIMSPPEAPAKFPLVTPSESDTSDTSDDTKSIVKKKVKAVPTTKDKKIIKALTESTTATLNELLAGELKDN